MRGSHSEGDREELVGAYAKTQTLDTEDACLVDVKSLQFSFSQYIHGLGGMKYIIQRIIHQRPGTTQSACDG